MRRWRTASKSSEASTRNCTKSSAKSKENVEVDNVVGGTAVEDVEKGLNSLFQDENLQVFQDQVRRLGDQPLEYIPLSKIKSELAILTEALNKGMTIDDHR